MRQEWPAHRWCVSHSPRSTPAAPGTPIPRHSFCMAACGCFSAGDAGFVRSLWTSPLEGGDAALTVNGVEHQITVTPTAEGRLLALAMRHATAED